MLAGWCAAARLHTLAELMKRNKLESGDMTFANDRLIALLLTAEPFNEASSGLVTFLLTSSLSSSSLFLCAA